VSDETQLRRITSDGNSLNNSLILSYSAKGLQPSREARQLAPKRLEVSTSVSGSIEVYTLLSSGTAGRGVAIGRVRGDGTLESRTVAHIPSWQGFSDDNVKVVLGNNSNQSSVNIVFNKAARSSYEVTASLSRKSAQGEVPVVYHRNASELPPWELISQNSNSRKRKCLDEQPSEAVLKQLELRPPPKQARSY
jgi:hypothetical protein